MTLLADLAFLAAVPTPATDALVLRVLERAEVRVVVSARDPVAAERTRDLAIGGIRIIGGRG